MAKKASEGQDTAPRNEIDGKDLNREENPADKNIQGKKLNEVSSKLMLVLFY